MGDVDEGPMSSGTCPGCGAVHDAATSPFDPGLRPDEGSISVCFECSHVAIFTGQGLEVREPTDEELVTVLADPRMRKLLDFWTVGPWRSR